MLWHLGFFPYIPAIGLPNETCRHWINREWGSRKVKEDQMWNGEEEDKMSNKTGPKN